MIANKRRKRGKARGANKQRQKKNRPPPPRQQNPLVLRPDAPRRPEPVLPPRLLLPVLRLQLRALGDPVPEAPAVRAPLDAARHRHRLCLLDRVENGGQKGGDALLRLPQEVLEVEEDGLAVFPGVDKRGGDARAVFVFLVGFVSLLRFWLVFIFPSSFFLPFARRLFLFAFAPRSPYRKTSIVKKRLTARCVPCARSCARSFRSPRAGRN